MIARGFPIGAEVLPGGGAHFRVWAPVRKRVEVVFEGGPGAPGTVGLAPERGGYWSGTASAAAPGSRYRFRLDGSGPYPDPASRFQPDGPHGASCVVDSRAFPWTDGTWRGVPIEGQVIYELHIGTFTREGTWTAAAAQLPELASCGISVVELMPVAEFPGRFGWGYDGVDLFAPTRLYGEPDDLRRFVNTAHGLGIAVILDVVYNHFGPDGNYLKEYSPHYFTDRYQNEWGEAINFDGPSSGPVREFFVSNALYWIEEFHMDGLRLDATQQIFDASPENILAEISRRTRQAVGSREIILVGENEPQHSIVAQPVEQGGYGLDALWNDDFHHSAVVALTGHNEAYYTDYRGAPQELVSAAKYGYLFQGQRYTWQKKRRGQPAFALRPAQFVTYVENHDQIANSGRGERLHKRTSVGRYKAAAALLLLCPGTPMLFQGQEFTSSAPFYYFADHVPGLREQIRRGRAEFLSQFPSLASPEMQACLADPCDPATFEICKLDFTERSRNAPMYRLHKDLMRLRRQDPVFRAQRRGAVDGAVLGPEAFVLRYFDSGHGDRLLVVNFGRDLHLDPAPEPLLAPPGPPWSVVLSTEHPRYGGCGAYAPETEENWRIPGHAALVLAPEGAVE